MVTEAVEEKQGPNPEAERRSVIDTPAPTETMGAESLIWWIAAQADEFEPFGGRVRVRDKQLRDFVPKEPYYASGRGVIAARNAGFSWQLEGPKLLTRRAQDVLDNANQGEGWQDLIIKTTEDLTTQDNAAFWEIVRRTDSPTGELIGINHLDAARCWHTGAPEAPVMYQDRNGKWHLLKWYQVVTLAEMPTAVEGRYGQQMCALSRMLKAAQIFRNISVYIEEKTGGRSNRALHLVSGVNASQVNDALNEQKILADAEGLMRYMQPAIVSSVDPRAEVRVATLELASLPDAFNEEVTWKHYVSIMAMAFLSDFQEFAPLPGGNLGTSAQSKTLHMKTRGKGPALFMKLISHALNFKILPKAVQFNFLEQDIEQEQAEAEVRKVRAEERSIRIQSGELLPEEARQLAVDSGDLPEELFMATGGLDVTPPEAIIEDSTQGEAEPNNANDGGQILDDEEQDANAKSFRFRFDEYL